jgi:hypothetical protein
MFEILKNILACLGLWFLTSVIFAFLFMVRTSRPRPNGLRPAIDREQLDYDTGERAERHELKEDGMNSSFSAHV